MTHFEPPIHWADHEDIAMKLYERFGDDFSEGRIYRIRFTDLLEWVLEIPNFAGKREESNEGHLEMIQSAWVYEWRDNQKNSPSISKPANMFKAFQQVSTFVFDVDGVMTDGAVLVMPNGLMARAMNIKDGYALQLAIKRGYKVLVISGGDSPEVKERLAKLGVTLVWMKAQHKKQILDQYLAEQKISHKEVLYMGDDIPDLEVMRSVGLPCCPADAATEIREASLYISPLNGGKGCVRDVIEKVLKLNGHWGEDSTVPSR